MRRSNYFSFVVVIMGMFVSVNCKSKDKTKDFDYEYYKNLNLTAELERQYDEPDKSEDYYKNIEKVEKTKKKDKKQKKRKEDEESEEWAALIQNFHPENLLTLKLDKNEHKNFYLDIETVPVTIRCAFYVHDEDSKIDFEIFDPKKKKIRKIKSKNRAFLNFNLTTVGTYKFSLDNERFKYEKKVTFAIHSGDNYESKLSLDHLQGLFNKLSTVESQMTEAVFSQKMLIRKHEGHFTSIERHNKNIVKYNILEVVIMIFIFIFQFIYLKRLIDKMA